jgi:hypothetical protein
MIMHPSIRRLALTAASLLLGVVAMAYVSSPDSQGYIRDWVMLAPIPLPEGGATGDLLLAEQVKGEAALKPKEGDKVKVGGRDLAWKNVTSPTNFFDFNVVLKSLNDRAAGFMVTYIECEQDIPEVAISVGSNDQARIYFNGTDIYAFTEARPLVLDSEKGKITLKKGVNTIVFKVLNEQNSWQGALRLTDRNGQPLKNIKVKQAP